MEKELAVKIVNKSLKIEEDEKVLITYESLKCNSFVKELIEEIILRKGIPFVRYQDKEINTFLLENTLENKYESLKEQMKFDVENFNCFINIKYNINNYEEKNIKDDIRNNISKATKKYMDIRTNKRKWVLLNYPSFMDAYKAKMKYTDYYEYAMKAMLYNFNKEETKIMELKQLMEKTDKVRITGKDTDISFSIKGIDIIPCLGTSNIPDGEIFTAPIKTSVNGKITYNTISPYQGEVFKDVSLTFKDGKIIEATCEGNEKKLNQILDTDEGSRYIGEFAIGFHPLIKNAMGDILYDEKIDGSIHFTPGAAYKEAYNGNDSLIHWDLVLIQREEYGGGCIYFDDKKIKKDGKFIF